MVALSVLQKIKPKCSKFGRITKDKWQSLEELSDHVSLCSHRGHSSGKHGLGGKEF